MNVGRKHTSNCCQMKGVPMVAVASTHRARAAALAAMRYQKTNTALSDFIDATKPSVVVLAGNRSPETGVGESVGE